MAACRSEELASGQVTELELFDTDILLFRGDDGRCQAIHAWCPHMGNYIPNGLAPGESINHLLQNGELMCPYHNWRFNGAGLCTYVPPGQRVPARVTASKPIIPYWQTREAGGLIQLRRQTRPMLAD